MENLFTKIVCISMFSGVLILATILFRLVFRSLSKKCITLLWVAVALRLTTPFMIMMPMGFFSGTDPVKIVSDPIYGAMGEAGQNMEIRSGIALVDRVVKPFVIHNDRTLWQGNADAILHQGLIEVLRVAVLIWLIGIALMILYLTVSAIRLHKRTKIHIQQENGIWLVDNVRIPFVYGAFRPKVVLPDIGDPSARSLVVEHERTHIKYGHQILKLLAFLILTLHWFNPLVWIAYSMFSKDLEMLCDERLLHNLPAEKRVEYAETLLRFAEKKEKCALALSFTGGGHKMRIRRILENRKHSAFVLALAMILSVFLAVVAFSMTGKVMGAKPLPEGESLMWEGVWLSGRMMESEGKLVFQADDQSNRWINDSLCLLRDKTEEDGSALRVLRAGDHIRIRFRNFVPTEPMTIDVREASLIK